MKLIYLAAASLFISGCSSAGHPVNLGEAKESVRNYYESGDFEKECKEKIDETIKFFDSKSFKENAAVVFDIDETVLSNYLYTKEIGFGYTQQSWDEWLLKGSSPPLKESLRLYNYLLSRKIHIIFLTGREEKFFESTKKNLIEAGFAKFDTLIVRSKEENNISAGQFKSSKRNELIKLGYDIIGSAGDQESDFSGGNTGIKIQIPNYLYLID